MSTFKKIMIGTALFTGYFVYKINNSVNSVGEVVTKDLNPASDENVVNKVVSKIVKTTTSNKFDSLGSYMYCLLNSKEIICNPDLLASAARNGIPFYIKDKNGVNIQNPQLLALWEQEKEFYYTGDDI